MRACGTDCSKPTVRESVVEDGFTVYRRRRMRKNSVSGEFTDSRLAHIQDETCVKTD